MKLITAFVLVVAAGATVSASPSETNGDRMARGLPPLPPTRRTPTDITGAHKGKPSSVPPSCHTGPIQCCEHVGKASSDIFSGLLHLLGISVDRNTLVGSNCSPVTVSGAGKHSCYQQTVCCDNDHYNGRIVVGCSPINI